MNIVKLIFIMYISHDLYIIIKNLDHNLTITVKISNVDIYPLSRQLIICSLILEMSSYLEISVGILFTLESLLIIFSNTISASVSVFSWFIKC
jgi:hypothetical protein